MAARGRGGGKTPERLVAFVREAVENSSQSAVAREVGVPLYTVQRCMNGIGEPSTSTLQKFADYFGISLQYLRGESDIELPWEMFKDEFENDFVIFKDLIELFNITPEHLKQSLIKATENYTWNMISNLRLHKNNIEQVKIDNIKVMLNQIANYSPLISELLPEILKW